MIVKGRLALVVEERKLVAEVQGGFRKGKRFREQIITLMHLQTWPTSTNASHSILEATRHTVYVTITY